MTSYNLTNTLIDKLQAIDKGMEYTDSKIKSLKLRVPKLTKKDPRNLTKVFYLYYRINGRKRKYKIGNFGEIGLTEARKSAEKLLAQIALGNDPFIERLNIKNSIKSNKSNTLREFLDKKYYPYAKIHQKGFQVNKKIIERNWANWMNKSLDYIQPSLVDIWKAKRLTDGVTPQTINRSLNTLKSVISYAYAQGCINTNYLQGYKRLKVTGGSVVRYLSVDEEINLYKEIYKRSDQVRCIVIIMLNTGGRPNEVYSLTWKDIDFNLKNVIYKGAYTKSSTTRVIPLNEKCIIELLRWKSISSTVLLFPADSISGYTTSIVLSFKKMLKRAEISDFRLYDLRHAFASKLIMNGVDVYTVSKLLGHSDIKMTEIYAHLSNDFLQKAVDVL